MSAVFSGVLFVWACVATAFAMAYRGNWKRADADRRCLLSGKTPELRDAEAMIDGWVKDAEGK